LPGSELDVKEEGKALRISCDGPQYEERVSIDVSNYGGMTKRAIHAFYRRGTVDLHLQYQDPDTLKLIQSALGRETVGFELLEIGENHCVIKHVAGEPKELGQLVRQIFLILLSMAEEGQAALTKGNKAQLNALVSLEGTNNRFTTIVRRYVNADGDCGFDKIGPYYYIIEQLERVADEYKYFYGYLLTEKKISVKQEHLDIFTDVNTNMRAFYELFYSFDPKKLAKVKNRRDEITQKLMGVVKDVQTTQDAMMFHYLMTINNSIFSLVDPFLTLLCQRYIVH
jgi:phosphate uptake regulator